MILGGLRLLDTSLSFNMLWPVYIHYAPPLQISPAGLLTSPARLIHMLDWPWIIWPSLLTWGNAANFFALSGGGQSSQFGGTGSEDIVVRCLDSWGLDIAAWPADGVVEIRGDSEALIQAVKNCSERACLLWELTGNWWKRYRTLPITTKT